MARVHFNNFRTTLNGSMTDVTTSMTLASSIPSLSGNTVNLTIYGGGVYEIVTISSNTGAPTYTVTRAQEGTTAVAWPDGSKVECRVTRDSIDTKQDDLSNGAAITTATPAAGDLVLFQDVGSGNVLRSATAEDIANLATDDVLVLIDTQTASASASLNFTDLGDYAKIHFVINDLIPATDDKVLYIRTSTDNGSSYNSGASDYAYVVEGRQGSTILGQVSSAATHIRCQSDANAGTASGNGTGEYLNGDVYLYNPTSAAYRMLSGNTCWFNSTPGNANFTGVRKTAADIDAVQFFFASGNITSGTIYAYGIKKS